jgi:AraC family L-rhamnose operon regulatory protein RhaS
MNLMTKGRSFHANIRLPIVAAANRFLDDVGRIGARYKLFVVHRGQFVAAIRGRRFLIGARSLLFLNERDALTVEERTDLDYSAVVFHPSLINARFDCDSVRSPDAGFGETDTLDLHILVPFFAETEIRHLRLGQLTYHRISRQFTTIQKMLERQDEKYWPCKARSSTIEVLFLLRAMYDGESPGGPTALDNVGDTISRVILSLHSNYAGRITIDGLARSFHTNRTTLSGQFKARTGATIIEYVNRLRIEIACQLLRDTSCPIGEIAERTGFPDLSNFGRTYKRQVGLSPSTYRAQHEGLRPPVRN